MANIRCPGMNPANFKPEDLRLYDCVHCGRELEFWKDDIKIQCFKCGQINFNPGLGSSCLSWCKSATDCLGNNDVRQWLAQNKHRLQETE